MVRWDLRGMTLVSVGVEIVAVVVGAGALWPMFVLSVRRLPAGCFGMTF